MSNRAEWSRTTRARLRSVAQPAVLLCLLLLAAPLVGQDEQELSQPLIEQRIATLRDSGIVDSDETLRAYEAAQSWLNRASAYTRDAARFVAELTEAPMREAMAQDRLDAMEFEDVATDDFEPLSREDLEAELLLTQSELRDANEKRDLMDRRLAARETNAETARFRLGDIATRLAQIPDEGAVIDATAAPSLSEANQWLQRAELTALREERRALSAQLDSQPGRYSALHAERAEIQFTIDRLARRAAALAARSRSKRSPTPAAAPLDLAAGTPAYEIGTSYQAMLLELSERQRTLETRLTEIQDQREMVERATRVVSERFARAKRMVQFAAQSEAIGGALLASWRELEELRLDSPRRGIPRQIGDIVISRIQHEEQLAGIVSASAYLNAWIADADLTPESVNAQEREALRNLLRLRRELLRSIIAAESGCIDALSELEADYARHAAKIAEYQRYLEPLVLWIPSGKLLWQTNFSVVASEIPALARSIGRAKASFQSTFFASIVLALGVLLSSSRLRKYQMDQTGSLLDRERTLLSTH